MKNDIPISRPENDNPLRDEFAKRSMEIILDSWSIGVTIQDIYLKKKVKGIGLISYAIADSMMCARKTIIKPDKEEK